MEQIQEKAVINIKEKVKDFIRNNFLLGDESKQVYDDDSLLENGIIDSTGVLELVSFIEETFNIKVEDEELIPDNLDSVNKLIIYINSKTSNL